MRLYKILPLLLLAVLALAAPPSQAEVSRFPNGLTNVGKTDFMGNLPILNPTRLHVFFNDFTTCDTADWTLNSTPAVDHVAEPTEDIIDSQFGALLITSATSDNDFDFIQTDADSFKMVSGKKTWFEVRLQGNEVTQSDLVVGLCIGDATTPIDTATDGIFFEKTDGAANWDFHVRKDGTSTEATAVDTFVANTNVILGFYYDGASQIKYWVDDVHTGTSVTTNIPNDEELSVTFGYQNGAAGSKTLTIDYIFVAQER